MYCRHCGYLIADDSKFCFNCGKAVDGYNFNPAMKVPQSEEARVEKQSDEFNGAATTVHSKYDLTYKTDGEVSGTGIAIIVFSVIAGYIIRVMFENSPELIDDIRLIIGILSLILRVTVLIWVFKIADKLNREAASWAFFGFLFPAITLIILGQKKKLKRIE